jgi:hypothetical protein
LKSNRRKFEKLSFSSTGGSPPYFFKETAAGRCVDRTTPTALHPISLVPQCGIVLHPFVRYTAAIKQQGMPQPHQHVRHM